MPQNLIYPQPLQFINLKEHNVCFYDEGKSDNNAPTLIFIHGLAGCMDNWIPTLEFFSQKFRTIALDLPGFGLSEKKDFNYGIPFFEEIIKDLIFQLKIKNPLLIGNSMGGHIVLNFSLSYPDVPCAIILVDTGGVQKYPHILKLLLKFFSQLNTSAFPFSKIVLKRIVTRLFFQPSKHSQILYENALLKTQENDFPLLIKSTIKCINSIFNTSPLEKIQQINIPTLILWGENDKATPVSEAHFCKKLIKNSKLITYNGCGHLPQLEKEEEFNKAVETFISSLSFNETQF